MGTGARLGANGRALGAAALAVSACVYAAATYAQCVFGKTGGPTGADGRAVFPSGWLRGVVRGAGGGDCDDALGAPCMSASFTRRNASHVLPMRIGRHRQEGAGGTRKVRQIAGDDRFFRLEVHSVAIAGSKTAVDDWMFCEVPDMINVLVEDAGMCSASGVDRRMPWRITLRSSADGCEEFGFCLACACQAPAAPLLGGAGVGGENFGVCDTVAN